MVVTLVYGCDAIALTKYVHRQTYKHLSKYSQPLVVVPAAVSTFCHDDSHTDSQGENNISVVVAAGEYLYYY